ncbi:uncharacterized [Tachysurus ichikawai]
MPRPRAHGSCRAIPAQSVIPAPRHHMEASATAGFFFKVLEQQLWFQEDFLLSCQCACVYENTGKCV